MLVTLHCFPKMYSSSNERHNVQQYKSTQHLRHGDGGSQIEPNLAPLLRLWVHLLPNFAVEITGEGRNILYHLIRSARAGGVRIRQQLQNVAKLRSASRRTQSPLQRATYLLDETVSTLLHAPGVPICYPEYLRWRVPF